MWFHCNECQGFWERHFKKPKKTNLGRKQNVAEICNDNDDNEENEDDGSPEFDKDSEISESDKSNVEEEDYENICQLNPPLNEWQELIHLRNVWSELNPPVSKKELWHFFGANCYTDIDKKKKPKVFVDILLHRYLADVDGPTVTIKIKISPW